MFASKVLRALFLVAASSLVLGVGPASAGHRQHPHYDHGYEPEAVVIVGGLPTRIRHLGTFAGAISAIHVRGTGNFFYVSGSGYRIERPYIRPLAKIISVDSGDRHNACSMENGVCVIRISPN